jgi:hypothetical protein
VKVLRIAETSIGVAPEGSDLRVTLGRSVSAFCDDFKSPDISLSAVRGELPQISEGVRVFNANNTWNLTRSNGKHCFRFFTPQHRGIPYQEALVSPDFATGRLTLQKDIFPENTNFDPTESPLFEVMLVHYLSSRGGVMVHGCGIVNEEGEGYLFLGHSGAGKTTTATLWEKHPDVRILSDDRIVIRKQSQGFVIYGTPWCSESRFSLPKSAPLKAIFILEHSARSILEPIPGAKAVGEFIARSFLPFYDQARMDAIVSLFAHLSSEVPCFVFGFRPDETAVNAVRKWSEG